MKIVHISDVHLGLPLRSLANKAQEIRSKVRDAFANAIKAALSEKADVVVISGDLFDNPYPSELNIKFVRDLLYELSDNDIKTVILPGNHDRLEEGSVFTKIETIFQNDPNIFVFDSPEKKEIKIEDLKLSFFANTVSEQKSSLSPLQGISELLNESESEVKIVIAHGSVEINNKGETNFPISKSELESLKCDYIALGDWHTYMKVTDKAYYPGAIENVDFKSDGGNILIVEITDGNLDVAKRRVGELVFDTLVIDGASFLDINELKDKLAHSATKNMLRSVQLTGSLNFDVDLDELDEFLRDKFLYLTIEDLSYKNINWDELSKNSEEHTILSEYISILRNKIKQFPDNPEYKQALLLGINEFKKNIK